MRLTLLEKLIMLAIVGILCAIGFQGCASVKAEEPTVNELLTWETEWLGTPVFLYQQCPSENTLEKIRKTVGARPVYIMDAKAGCFILWDGSIEIGLGPNMMLEWRRIDESVPLNPQEMP